MGHENGPNLRLRYMWSQRESGWGVWMNDNLFKLDALVQLAVLDKDLTTPPGSPTDGDRYIVPSGATGAWSGQTDNIAIWRIDDQYPSGTWIFYFRKDGWLAWVIDERKLYVFDTVLGGWSIIA